MNILYNLHLHLQRTLSVSVSALIKPSWLIDVQCSGVECAIEFSCFYAHIIVLLQVLSLLVSVSRRAQRKKTKFETSEPSKKAKPLEAPFVFLDPQRADHQTTLRDIGWASIAMGGAGGGRMWLLGVFDRTSLCSPDVWFVLVRAMQRVLFGRAELRGLLVLAGRCRSSGCVVREPLPVPARAALHAARDGPAAQRVPRHATR